MKKKEMQKVVWEMKRKRDSCGLHSMTFAPCPTEAKEQMEKHQRERFLLWWDSWILPGLEFLEHELNNGQPQNHTTKGTHESK